MKLAVLLVVVAVVVIQARPNEKPKEGATAVQQPANSQKSDAEPKEARKAHPGEAEQDKISAKSEDSKTDTEKTERQQKPEQQDGKVEQKSEDDKKPQEIAKSEAVTPAVGNKRRRRNTEKKSEKKQNADITKSEPAHPNEQTHQKIEKKSDTETTLKPESTENPHLGASQEKTSNDQKSAAPHKDEDEKQSKVETRDAKIPPPEVVQSKSGDAEHKSENAKEEHGAQSKTEEAKSV